MSQGVYKITNLINGKFYIGSTTGSIKKRKREHLSLLRRNKHHSRYLQFAYNKYGEQVFDFQMLEVCPKEDCLEKEQYYLDLLKPKYNMNPKAINCEGRKVSKITKEKISKKLKGIKVGERLSKEKRRELITNNMKPVLQYSLEGTFIKEWPSIKEIVTTLNLCQGNLSSCCNGKRNKVGKFKFKFKEI